jgi:hypothetical protein
MCHSILATFRQSSRFSTKSKLRYLSHEVEDKLNQHQENIPRKFRKEMKMLEEICDAVCLAIIVKNKRIFKKLKDLKHLILANNSTHCHKGINKQLQLEKS